MADPNSTVPVRPPTSSTSATTTDSSAIYYDISPTTVLAVRLFNVLVLLMVGIAFILTLVQSQEHETYYLLACNLVISSFVGIVVNWWYRSGDLGVEKYWYIILVGVVIVIQTVTTDILIFTTNPIIPDVSTLRPSINGTTRTSTWVTISNVTHNKSLLFPPTTPHSVPMVLDVY